MKKKAAKTLIIISGIVILVASAFMYFPIGLSQTPQPEIGRIYPVNRNGHVMGYATHREKVQRELSIGICALFILVAASTNYYLDPFDYRKQPWDRR